MTKLFEVRLEETRTALKKSLGTDFTTYCKLLESFLSGRITKEEFEGTLRNVLGASPLHSNLHNTFVGLVLEKLTTAEHNALSELATMQAAMGGEGEDGRVIMELTSTPTLHLSAISMTTGEQSLFVEATKRQPPNWPYSAPDTLQGDTVDFWTPTFNDPVMEERFFSLLMGSEKDLGVPLLSQLSRTLPDVTSIDAVLRTWLSVYNLDAASVTAEHVALIHKAFEMHLEYLIAKSCRLTESGELVLDHELLCGNCLLTDSLLTSSSSS